MKQILSPDWLYVNGENNKSRYVLGQPGKRPLICFGLNPSTAQPARPDPTMRSVMRIAAANGYDGWILLNLYPQRATRPDDMHQKRNAVLHRNNLSHIAQVLKQYPASPCWAAWGTLILKRRYLTDCLQDIRQISREQQSRWIHFHTVTKAGHPRHPLYLPAGCLSKDFDLSGYINHVSLIL